jgi:hypothetical protein
MNNSNYTLKETITNNQKYPTIMKTVVDDNVFPKTANILLTVYYTSYNEINVPQVIETTRKPLLRYFCTNKTYPAIVISVINSTRLTPRFLISIHNSNNSSMIQYIITADTPKHVIYLTADLAEATQGEKIVSAQFTSTDFGGDLNDFYQHSISLLSNLFISYTYDE